MRVLVLAGTRPEFVKMAPVIGAMVDAGHEPLVVVTGQHTDPAMADEILADLGVGADQRWTLPTGSESERLGALLANSIETIGAANVDAVTALGDTWTVPLAAMAARRFGLPFLHMEAGLRSFNERSVEEGNRRMAGQLASLHFAPTERNRDFLIAEGIDAERIVVVGNPVTDALRIHGAPRVEVDARHGALVTAHRATNVDDPKRLAQLVSIILETADLAGHVLFPVHPRTEQRLASFGLRGPLEAHRSIDLVEPLSYEDLLTALAASRLVVTDSGGLQEEAAWYGVPSVVMRHSTPRWEGIELDISAVVGVDPVAARRAMERFLEPDAQRRIATVDCPYGDGHAGRRIAEALHDPALVAAMAPKEPSFAGGRLPYDRAAR